MLVKTPEYINITDSSILSVEYSSDGPFVTMNDDAVLSRFVSCYKAGNPSQGENQTVRGVKTFEDRVKLQNLSSKGADNTGATILDNLFCIDIAGITKVRVESSGITFSDRVIAYKQVRIIPSDHKALNIEGSLTGIDSYTNVDSTYASIGESDHPFPRAYLRNAQTGLLRLGFSDGDGSVRCYTETTQGAYSKITLATTHGELNYVPPSHLAIPCLKWDSYGLHTRDIFPQVVSSGGYNIGSMDHFYNAIYAQNFYAIEGTDRNYGFHGNLYGLIPRPTHDDSNPGSDRSGVVITLPVGSIALINLKVTDLPDYPNQRGLEIGETITISSDDHYFAKWNALKGEDGRTAYKVPTGVYMALSDSGTYLGTDSFSPCLMIKVAEYTP